MSLNIDKIHERYLAASVDACSSQQITVTAFRQLVDAITATLLRGDFTARDYLEAVCLAQRKAALYQEQAHGRERGGRE